MVVLFIFTQRFGLLGTAVAFSLRCCLDFFLLFVFSSKEMKKIGIMETFPLKLKLVLIAQALVIVALCGIFVLK